MRRQSSNSVNRSRCSKIRIRIQNSRLRRTSHISNFYSLKKIPDPFPMNFRIGHGYDIPRIVTGRPLILGGVKFDVDFGLEGHSDADCLTHAICDALLGAAGLPDIGIFFPNTDTNFLNIDSQILLQRVCGELAKIGWRPSNVDVTVLAEKPKIYPRLGEIKA